MGVTKFSIDNLIAPYLKGVSKVVDLGAQNNYSKGSLPAPYMREWWEEKGIEYTSIDLSGECGALKQDLSKILVGVGKYDLVMDFGTSEHVGTTKKEYYQCWLNKWSLCKIGGLIVSENPMENNWPGHGSHYLGKDFYKEIENKNCKLIATGTHPAMGNHIDGWNVWGVIQKTGEQFVSFEEFNSYPIFKK